MKFLSLTINNFLSVRAAELHLADRGLNLLQGINEADSSAESNGAGKSTIADALCWALYGETARGASADAVVNNVAKKGTAVSVRVQDGSTVYVITRYRKHPTYKNSTQVGQLDSTGAFVDLSKGTEKETQALIDQILGCTLDVFKGAIYAGQEQMVDLPALTDKALKVLIEEAAGVKQLEAAYGVARQKVLDAEKALNDVRSRIATSEMYVKSETTTKQIAELKHAEFEQGREGRAQVFEQQAMQHKQAAMATLASIQGVDQAALEAERDALTQQTQGAQQATQAAAAFYSAQVRPAEQQEAQAKTMVEVAKREALTTKGRIDNAAVELAKPCHACGKPHTPDELDSFKAHQMQLLQQQVANAQTHQQTLVSAQAQLATVRAEHARLMGLIPDVSQVVAQINQVNAKITDVQTKKQQALGAVNQAKQLLERAEGARKEANPQQAVIDQCNARIAQHTQVIADAQPAIADAQRKVDIAQSVAQVFSPAGVRAHILDTVTPFLNERTANYLSTLSDGNLTAIWSTLTRNAKGETREKFGIEVANAEGGESFALISGGEKRKVRLACMLALQDLVASRATKSIDLWLGDEIDDAMDEAGLERLMTILEQKAREKGTVIVISHNSLKDWCDSVTTIRKVARGESVVEGSLTIGA